MITIYLHRRFLPEKKYVLNTIIRRFLGIDIEYRFHHQDDTHLVLPNQKRIIIKDHFFRLCVENQSFTVIQKLPKIISFLRNPLSAAGNLAEIPVIYGHPVCRFSTSQIELEIDIIAASFLLLSQWEALANSQRDQHQRFLSQYSCLHSLRLRPVVDEYTAFLRKLLAYSQYPLPEKNTAYALKRTHDIDHIYFYKNRLHCLKKMVGDIWKRKDWPAAKNRWEQYQRIAKNQENDPYNTFARFMEQAENHGETATFFVMAEGKTLHAKRNYALTERRTRRLLSEIQERGHKIALHGSYLSAENEPLFQKEKRRLEKFLKKEITQNRQHYLRFDTAKSLNIWENSRIRTDFSGGFADRPGFRFGTSRPFPLFNIEKRKTSTTCEHPLLWMDAYATGKSANATAAKFSLKRNGDELKQLTATCKALHIPCTVLFHNSSFFDYGTEMDAIWEELNNY